MEVYCKFGHVNFTFEKNKNLGGYTCKVDNIVFNPAVTGIKIFGDHAEGMDHRNVVGLNIDKLPHIDSVPRGFGHIFPNLMYLQIRRCSLKIIRKEDFLDLGNLRGLWLPENPLVSLPSDIFTNVQGLRHLCFYKNHLKYIGADILTPLKHLQRANFKENTCIDIAYDMDKDPITKLQELKRDIAQKCQKPMPLMPNNTNEFETRLSALENEVTALKIQNQHLSAKVTQLQNWLQ